MENYYYNFILNADGYICGYSKVDENGEYYGSLKNYPNICAGYYVCNNGVIIEDIDKKEEVENELIKKKRIAFLKRYLNETDYIWNSIREGGRTEEYYAEVIETRKAYRKEIQELEK